MKPRQKIRTSAPHHHFFFLSYTKEDDDELESSSSSSIGLFWVVNDNNEPHSSLSPLGHFLCCVIVIYLEFAFKHLI
jgi:hypothetical protein